MSGYEWHPIFRMTPENGIEETADLRLEFPDTGGPNRITLRWRNENERRTDINRKVHIIPHGFRFYLQMEIEIFDMEHHDRLAEIVNRLQSDQWTMAVSLDGGVNYRDVEISDVPWPQPLGGKTFAGASYRLDLIGSEILEELPGQSAGGW